MIRLGQIEIDQAILERQLRHDLKDDWFPDAVRFKDFFGRNRIVELAEANFELNHGVYEPQRRVVRNVPKPDFTLRSALEIGLVDRAIYHGVCSYLCQHFDEYIPWRSFGYRAAVGDQRNRYMFRRGIPSWMDFLGTVRASLKQGTVLLSTDLTTYFDSINIEKLKGEMFQLIEEMDAEAKQKSNHRAYVEFLFSCLEKWSYEGTRGLPQNRDASSFLANFYMRKVDILMERRGYEYFRYMDDIKIVASSKIEAQKALRDLIVELRQLGLAVNSKKTEMIEIADDDSIRSAVEEPSEQLRFLQSLWETRRISQIKQSFVPLRNLAIDFLKSQQVNSREFNFAINRLVLLAGCKEIAVPADYFSEIVDLVITALPEAPSRTEAFVSLLQWVSLSDEQIERIVDFQVDRDRNIYGWQGYQIWLLLGTRKIECDRLIQAAKQAQDEPDGPYRAGATLYLGAFGTEKDRQEIAKKFESLESFVGQRAALLAIQDLPFKPDVKKHVVGKVRPDLDGAYKQAKTLQLGQFVPPDPVSVTQIVDVDRDYA
ncbi:MAG: RNA-directed DNA polymerase [Pseudomonadota bacterium]